MTDEDSCNHVYDDHGQDFEDWDSDFEDWDMAAAQAGPYHSSAAPYVRQYRRIILRTPGGWNARQAVQVCTSPVPVEEPEDELGGRLQSPLRKPSFWFAVARAERKAADYFRMRKAALKADLNTRAARNGARKAARASVRRVTASVICAMACAKVAARVAVAQTVDEARRRTVTETSPLFETLRKKFLDKYGHQIRESLGHTLHHFDLIPTPLALGVQQRFLEACSSDAEDVDGFPCNLCPAFHGTVEANLQSIYVRGLLIPGKNNEIRVANGSAHGLGIYAGKSDLGGCRLSNGFCRGGPMLVCGVIDDAVPVNDYQVGYRRVFAESESIRHVGSAMVVFDCHRIAPLFFTALPKGITSADMLEWDNHKSLLKRLGMPECRCAFCWGLYDGRRQS